MSLKTSASKQGKILAFSRYTLWGTVKVEGILYAFPSTCFVADDTPRFPHLNEDVDVTMNESETVILALHGKSKQPTFGKI